MQVPLLDGAGHDQTTEEEEVGVHEVLGADVFGLQDTQEGEEDDGQQGCHRQGQRLRAPVHGHEQDDKQTAAFLQRGRGGGEMQAQHSSGAGE